MTAANQVNWFGKHIRHTGSAQQKNRLAAIALIVNRLMSYRNILSLYEKRQHFNFGLRIYLNQMALHFSK